MNEETKRKLSEIMKLKWLSGVWANRKARCKMEFVKCNRRYWTGSEYTNCTRLRFRDNGHCTWCEDNIEMRKKREVQRYYPNKYNPEVILDIEL